MEDAALLMDIMEARELVDSTEVRTHTPCSSHGSLSTANVVTRGPDWQKHKLYIFQSTTERFVLIRLRCYACIPACVGAGP